jgi:repressor LexA
MVGSGILDGDYVLARRQHNAEAGDIVVFIIGDEITVKTFETKGDKVLLIPSNESYETRIIKKNSSDLQIAGKVIGLLRKY